MSTQEPETPEIVESAPGPDGAETDDSPGPTVSEPAKVMRIGTMIKQLLEEVRQTTLDEPGRDRLREIYETSVEELSGALAPDLRQELARLALPFEGDEVPSEAELHIAQAQLVGWLEGLFAGIQATLFAQQAAARQQVEMMQQSQPLGPGQQRPDGTPGGQTGGVYL